MNNSEVHQSIRRSQMLGIMLFVFTTSVFATFCMSPHTHATASTLSLSISDATVSLSLAPTSANGTFAKSANTTISIATTNTTGYALTIKAGTSGANLTKLVSSADSTIAIESITTATTETDFKASNNTAYNGKWGYLPSKYNSVINSNYLPAPTTTGDLIDQTNTANTTTNTYSLAIGARIDSSTPPGSYSNTFIIQATANSIPYSITYNANGGSNAPQNISSTTLDVSEPLSSASPTRTNYTFLGWCSGTSTASNITTANNIDSCSASVYQPGDALPIDQTSPNNNNYLYAMWRLPTIANSTTLQEVTACPSTLTNDQVFSLQDTRDNRYYSVAKLADGKCWLLDNLALDPLNSTVLNGMNENNTNASNTTLGYFKGTNARNPSSDPNGKYATAGVAFWESTIQYSFSAPLVNMTKKDTVPTDSTSAAGGYKVGGFYNFCAASAGSYCYGNGLSMGTSSGNSTEDLCPKGWRMPSGDASGEYQAVYNLANYNTYATYRAALHLPLSGNLGDYGSIYNINNYAGIWSSTRYDNQYVYRVYVDKTSLDPAFTGDRANGRVIRCIFKS